MLYQSIQILEEYILIDSLSVKVEQHIRDENNIWIKKEYNGLHDRFLIKSIQYAVSINDLYRDTTW